MKKTKLQKLKDLGLLGAIKESKITSENYKIVLDDIDRDIFLDALANPPAPNDKFIEAMDSYMESKKNLMKNLANR